MVSGRWQINEQNEQINLLIENKAHYKFLPTFQASLICSIVSISVQHNILEENWGESSSKIRTKFIMCHKFITIRKSYAHHTHTPKTFIILLSCYLPASPPPSPQRLCSELSVQPKNQRGQWTFVFPVNLLYQTAINVSVGQVIKPRRSVCFISRLAGMGNSETHTRRTTENHRTSCTFVSEGFLLFLIAL